MEYPNYKILYFAPNLIGYVRLMLLAASWYYITNNPIIFITLYGTSAILDAFDGIAARYLNQTSAFGAWFDIVIDNIGRGIIWSYTFEWGYFVSVLEWLVFVCTHTHGPSWKKPVGDSPPFLVKAVMANNFKTAIGVYTISGLHVLPLWLYSLKMLALINQFLASSLITAITIVLVSGRVTCSLVEFWFLWTHIKALLTDFRI
ncbi:CDP-diacylglycerol--inositol 3-phosphatidyltransferase 1-like [Xenia sp. Carnegie-2017]|uniref:CDP-diacylglycerol--inositol 3-phosphatidyltransferase 1-like n=1 Tax=Xenia sp. Carnegie-2017 TaxID=2897299 RepID=UPI001F03762E|nr:CDP-diacylglycerol--inositol 3-phosphatidyltransferase 1-like [Xenia sp. Carnegie-2017]